MPHRIVKCNRKYNNELVDDGWEGKCLFIWWYAAYTRTMIYCRTTSRLDGWTNVLMVSWLNVNEWMNEGWGGTGWYGMERIQWWTIEGIILGVPFHWRLAFISLNRTLSREEMDEWYMFWVLYNNQAIHQNMKMYIRDNIVHN